MLIHVVILIQIDIIVLCLSCEVCIRNEAPVVASGHIGQVTAVTLRCRPGGELLVSSTMPAGVPGIIDPRGQSALSQ